MCGIAGFLSPSIYFSRQKSMEIGKKMANAIMHRGPDADGVWLNHSGSVCLSHRRLSIVDITDAGHQPMISNTGRFALVYNGEIYNFPTLRAEIEAMDSSIHWHGNSDTEVLLNAICLWGLENTLLKLNGMFALALWDEKKQVLFLARDRLGEKPLYFGTQNKTFFFASELKAIKVHPRFSGKLNRSALALYCRYNYIPSPHCIYDGFSKLEPGQFVEITPQEEGEFRSVSKRYWQQPIPCADPMLEYDAAKNTLEKMLAEAIDIRRHADVPLGAFLSGGIDSSLIVALMQKASDRAVKTFSMGFEEKEFDEAPFAKEVAKHLRTDHTEMYVTAQHALDLAPAMPQLYDEPFADSSQIPTYLVSKLTRQNVTVALSGDAGDELFGGYNRYFQLKKLASLYRYVPYKVRQVFSQEGRSINPETVDRLCRFLHLSQKWGVNSDRLQKAASAIGQPTLFDAYKRLVTCWEHPDKLLGYQEPKTIIDEASLRSEIGSPYEWMMFIDTVTYLPENILVKVDRAAMGVSLETRIPFLDPNIVEFAAALPLSFKLHHGKGKRILRDILFEYVPKSMIERPKTGFGVPLTAWLRGPLRDWAETLLSEEALNEHELFDVNIVRTTWAAHLSGQENRHYPLWNILMFQGWWQNARPEN